MVFYLNNKNTVERLLCTRCYLKLSARVNPCSPNESSEGGTGTTPIVQMAQRTHVVGHGAGI